MDIFFREVLPSLPALAKKSTNFPPLQFQYSLVDIDFEKVPRKYNSGQYWFLYKYTGIESTILVFIDFKKVPKTGRNAIELSKSSPPLFQYFLGTQARVDI